MTSPARADGRWSRAAAIVSGISASPRPWSARPVTSTGRLPASAATAPPSVTTARQTRSVWRRCGPSRSEEHTSELQSRQYLVCRLLLEKKKQNINTQQKAKQNKLKKTKKK